MTALLFTSSLALHERPQLERIFFFNHHQPRYRERIMAAIEAYSKPVVVEEGGRVFLAFERREVGQALHIFEPQGEGRRLLGALLYTRDRPERLTVAHIALRERSRNDFTIITAITEELRAIARRVKGVEQLYFFYADVSLRVG